jgi:alpha(1,3/1,4) fucosyltransferase
MKPNIVLGFADTFSTAVNFFTDVLSQRFNVIRDDRNPKYLIFGDSNFGQTHFNYQNCTKIFYTGENVRPNYFTYDYAMTFDMENSSRHYRLPLYVLEMHAIVHDNKFTDNINYLVGLHSRIDWEKEWNTKTVDYTYIQSNPNCGFRNQIVQYILNSGAKIECGGPHFNNIGRVIPRDRLLKFDFIRRGKVNVAIENGPYPGYVTEKILDAFYSNTLPLYWGSDTVDRDFNPNCFVWMTTNHFYTNPEYMTKKGWCDLMSQPRFNYDIPNEYTQIDNLLDWFTTFVFKG